MGLVRYMFWFHSAKFGLESGYGQLALELK